MIEQAVTRIPRYEVVAHGCGCVNCSGSAVPKMASNVEAWIRSNPFLAVGIAVFLGFWLKTNQKSLW